MTAGQTFHEYDEYDEYDDEYDEYDEDDEDDDWHEPIAPCYIANRLGVFHYWILQASKQCNRELLAHVNDQEEDQDYEDDDNINTPKRNNFEVNPALAPDIAVFLQA